MNKSVLAIIPARSGSKRLENKNILKLKGIPLIAYTIKAALDSGVFSKVFVSTDSEKYAEISLFYGASVDFLRPKELSNDSAASIDVIRHAILEFKSRGIVFDYVCLLQPTSPLRNHIHIQEAKSILYNKNADSVVSVCSKRINAQPLIARTVFDYLEFSGLGNEILRDNERIFYPNGAIYFFDTGYILKNDIYYSSNSYLHLMDNNLSIDIDNSFDFKEVEGILNSI